MGDEILNLQHRSGRHRDRGGRPRLTGVLHEIDNMLFFHNSCTLGKVSSIVSKVNSRAEEERHSFECDLEVEDD